MGTTDPQLAIAALQVMSAAGVRYAMLHGRERLLQGYATDVDLVVDTDPDLVIADTKTAFASTGLFPVVVNPYDLAGTRSAWYALDDATGAVQLDFLHDIDGLGRLGVRSAGLLASATGHAFPPFISEEAELVYLWRKRIWKRQAQALSELARAAAIRPRAKLIAASITVTGSERTAQELLGERRVPTLGTAARRPISMAVRNARRVRHPVGYWIHARTELVAADVASSFGRFLPRATAGPAPSSTLGSVVWFWRRVQPVRLRPGVYVSHGKLPGYPRPDLTLSESIGPDSARKAVVAAMASRF